MAEVFLPVLVQAILQQLETPISQEIGSLCCFESQQENLKMKFSALIAVLEDAEEKKHKNNQVMDWLEKLRVAAYEVEDLLDEVATEELRKQKEIAGGLKEKVCTFFSCSNPILLCFRIGYQLKKIMGRLDSIAADKGQFELKDQPRSVHDEVGEGVQAHSFVNAKDVIGRDEDMEEIICCLMQAGDSENVSVIPIVGIAGLGKTTLAKLVYNDDRITTQFDLKMWVSVGKDLNVTTWIGKIVKSVTSINVGELDLEKLVACLRDNLSGKKFILVLDDVWNDSRGKWLDVREPLNCGAKGSKIIVTTRSRDVAHVMGTIPAHILKGLSEDGCWSLFKKWAFGEEGMERADPILVSIGKEIVKKCDGVPLAVRTLGCLLYKKTDENYWSSVRDSNIWELPQNEGDILPALMLSYDRMSSYLKQCFAYCSLFRKDDDINRETLIQLWMAQGYIPSVDRNRKWVATGNQYFKELLSRSFFEEKDHADSSTEMVKMHSLIHDLARSVTVSKCLIVDSHTISEKISERIRHMSLRTPDFEKHLTSILKMKKVRTLIFPTGLQQTSKPLLDALIMRFRRLRMLDLSYSTLDKLPSSIGKLKHLRYLKLNENQKITKLPNSICKLYNLQSLKFGGCRLLQKLPRDTGKIISLVHLEITSQMISLCAQDIAGLTSLQSLTIVACEQLTTLNGGIEQLASLKKLSIVDCPVLAALPSSMWNLSALEKLEIRDCSELKFSTDRIPKGIENLKSFSIINLPKLVELPLVLQHSAATLEHLCISQIHSLVTLAEWIGNLKSIKTLYISYCPGLLSLPEGMRRLTNLQVLRVEFCHHLSSRCNRTEGEDWPKIQHVPEIYLDKIKIKPMHNREGPEI